MKTLLAITCLTVGFCSLAQAQQAPTTLWRSARVLSVAVLETMPPTYAVTYIARCNDKQAKLVKLTTETETVIGIAVERDLTRSSCTAGEPRVSKLTSHFKGGEADPAQVRVLR